MRILLSVVLMFMSSMAMAIDGTYDLSYRSPKSVEHGTVAISSLTAVQVAFGGPSSFTEVRLSSAAVVYRYTIDGSSASIQTRGFPVAAGVEYKISGSTNPVWVMGAGGVAAGTINKLVITH